MKCPTCGCRPDVVNDEEEWFELFGHRDHDGNPCKSEFPKPMYEVITRFRSEKKYRSDPITYVLWRDAQNKRAKLSRNYEKRKAKEAERLRVKRASGYPTR